MSNSRKRKITNDANGVDLTNSGQIADETVSKYFTNDEATVEKKPNSQPTATNSPLNCKNVVSELLTAVDDLNQKLNRIQFSSPIKYVYNPTQYAFDSFKNYIQKFGNTQKKIILLGMNPGPWGMSQTGVPFGEVDAVKNWLKITGTIHKPSPEDPGRPVLGFECQRSEVSGKRFWGLAQYISKTPETFFKNCYIHNYCPLQFIGPNSKNVTPDGLKIAEREALYSVCDETLLRVVNIFNSNIVIGIGKFAETRFRKVAKEHNLNNVEIHCIPHPSPRAVGNQNWQEKALEHLTSLKLLQHFTD